MKLNYKRTFFVGLAFMSICAFWQVYDNVIPLILKDTFHVRDSYIGIVMAMDNVLALFMLPLFGKLSDKTRTKIGRRMPYILGGTILALLCLAIMPAAQKQNNALLFFIGLFIVVGGLQETGVIQIVANTLVDMTAGHMTLTILLILWVSAIISAFLDNIPFVATLIPLILTMESSGVDVAPLWWAVSLGACLGGNGTLIGASANVVLSGISNRHGFPITFASYFKVGFPLMLLSVGICTIYMLLRYC